MLAVFCGSVTVACISVMFGGCMMANTVSDSLILLFLAHFVCDFTLQTDRMAREKVPGRDVTLDWRIWLLSHAATHGLAVALITGLPLLGLAELVLHAIIDWSKSRFRFSLACDQALHIVCKIVWALQVSIVFS